MLQMNICYVIDLIKPSLSRLCRLPAALYCMLCESHCVEFLEIKGTTTVLDGTLVWYSAVSTVESLTHKFEFYYLFSMYNCHPLHC